MSSNVLTNFEIEDPNEPSPEQPVKHKALYGMFVVSSVVAPWAAGAVILTHKQKLEEWGWI